MANLAALFAIVAFAYLAAALPRQISAESRLSPVLTLAVSSVICLVTSVFASKWLARTDGRFGASRLHHQQQSTLLKTRAEFHQLGRRLPAYLASEPGKWTFPVLVLAMVVRWETLLQIQIQQQCASAGIEAFFGVLLLAHHAFTAEIPSADDDSDDEPDDPWRSMYDELRDWFSGPRVQIFILVFCQLLLSMGVFVALGQRTRSTYLCFTPVDGRPITITLQILGLILDAVIVVSLWRMVSWADSVRTQIRTISVVLGASAVALFVTGAAKGLISSGRSNGSVSGSLNPWNILTDGVFLAMVVICYGIWASESSPIATTSSTTIVFGMAISCKNVLHLGSWMQLSRAGALLPVWIIVITGVLFTRLHDIRHVIVLRRSLFSVLLIIILLVYSILSLFRHVPVYERLHPLSDMIYRAGIDHERWLRHASISSNLATAISTYKERHNGRNPPPKFDVWYQYATGSAIIDDFTQIDADLKPFRTMSPAELRYTVGIVALQPKVAKITIKGGQVTSNFIEDEKDRGRIASLLNKIAKFSQHLPDMVFPVNLDASPRVIPVNRHTASPQLRESFRLYMERTSDKGDEEVLTGIEYPVINAGEFKELHTAVCRKQSRTSWHQIQSDSSEFCASCAAAHSQATGYFFDSKGLDKSLGVCAQSDLLYLHEFFMTSPQLPPITDMLPIFSAAKTDAFQDILLPLPSEDKISNDISKPFDDRTHSLFWRGSATDRSAADAVVRGSQKHRLLHLANTPSKEDWVTLVLKTSQADAHYQFYKMPAIDANKMVSLDVKMNRNQLSGCIAHNCGLFAKEWSTEDNLDTNPLEYKYVLLLDDERGPSQDIVGTLFSQSVPVLSSVFKTWYTERLQPWQHFIPLDPRYQAFHTTLQYLTTRDVSKSDAKSGYTDGAWVGREGSRWALQALDEKSMEIYLFRLLIEWARLVNDDRESIA